MQGLGFRGCIGTVKDPDFRVRETREVARRRGHRQLERHHVIQMLKEGKDLSMRGVPFLRQKSYLRLFMLFLLLLVLLVALVAVLTILIVLANLLLRVAFQHFTKTPAKCRSSSPAALPVVGIL